MTVLALLLLLTASNSGPVLRAQWKVPPPGALQQLRGGAPAPATATETGERPVLAQGDDLLIPLGGAGAVRVVPQTSDFLPRQLTVFESRDAQLFVESQWTDVTAGPLVWRAAPGSTARYLLLRNQHPGRDLRLGVFLEELAAQAEARPQPIDPPLTETLILGAPGQEQIPLARLAPERPWRLRVEGPGVLRLRARLDLGRLASNRAGTATVVVRRGDAETLTHLTARPDPEAVTRRPDTPAGGPLGPLVGTERQIHVRLAAGEQTLDLETTAAVWLIAERIEISPADAPPLPLATAPAPRSVEAIAGAVQELTWGDLDAAAVTLLRNNAVRGAGVAGIGLARSLQERSGHPRDVARRGRQITSGYTTFRTLVPTERLENIEWGRVAARDTRRSGDVHLRADALQEGLRRLPLMAFHRVDSSTGARRYLLEPGPGSRRLRVAGRARDERGTTVRLIGSVGEDTVTHQLLVFPQPLAAQASSLAEAALLASSRHVSLTAAATTAPPFGATLAAAHLVSAGVGELVLPAGATEVALEGPELGIGLDVALQVETRPTFRLGEAELRTLIHQLRRGGTLAAQLATLRDPDTSTAAAWWHHELANHYLPVLRTLERRAQDLATAVVRPRPSPFPPAPSALEAPPSSSARQTLRWLADRERERALGPEELEARVRALLALDEGFLAERTLYGALAHGGEPVRRRAQALLAEHHRASGDTLGALRVAAFRLLTRPTTDALAEAVDSLLDAGQDTAALDLALLLPPAQRSPRLLLAAATEGWWQLFDELVQPLPEAEREQWQAYGSLVAGVTPPPEQLAHTPQLEAALEQAQLVRTRLDAFEPDALRDWYGFQAPGPRRSTVRNDLVRAAAGSVRLLTRAQTTSGSWWLATPETPLRLDLVGPRTLQLQVRPVHEADDGIVPPASRIDGWIDLAVGDVSRSVPVLGNRPSSDFDLLGPGGEIRQDARAGRVARIDVQVDLGPQELEIRPRFGPVLVRAEVDTSAVSPPSLPVARAAWLLPQPTSPGLSEDEDAALLCVHEARGEVACRARALAATALGPALALERCAGCRGETVLRAVLPGLTDAETELAREAVELLELGDTTAPERARGLARLSAELLVPGGSVELDPLRTEIDRATLWRQLTTVQSSAGIEQRRILGAEPESPALRTRLALLGSLPTDLHVVQGEQTLGVALSGARHLDVELFALQVPPLPPAPLDLVWQVDDLEEQSIRLTSDAASRDLKISVPVGSRSVRFRIDAPRPNQYAGLRVSERRGGQVVSLGPERLRNYQIASLDEPLRVRVRGPGQIRVDALDQGETVTRTSELDPGWQTVVLAPLPGQRRTLYRLFERVASPEPASPPRVAATGNDGVSRVATLTSFPRRQAPAATSPRIVYDEPRRGTSSFFAGVRQRRLLDEDVQRGTGADEFFELSWAHRRANPAETRYREVRTLARGRDGDGTFGAGATWRFAPERRSSVLRLEASAYTQQQGGRMEWSAWGRASLGRSFQMSRGVRHRPEVSLFARALSRDTDDAPVVGESIDQDVFTTYKANHRAGIELRDTLTWAARSNLQLFAIGSVRTNEELSPTELDRTELQLGLRQYLRPLLLDLRVRHALFFEDDDRLQRSERTRVDLRVEWERWNQLLARWAIRGSVNYDIDNDEITGALLFGRHFSAGRGLFDFRPQPGEFRTLRMRRARDG